MTTRLSSWAINAPSSFQREEAAEDKSLAPLTKSLRGRMGDVDAWSMIKRR